MSVLFIDRAGKEEPRADREKIEQTDYYKCGCSEWEDGLVEMLLFRRDLAPWQRHPDNPLLFVDTFEPVRIENSLFWDITVRSTSLELKKEEDKNPLARRAKITVGSVDRKRIRLIDARGKPVLNTAGDLIDDPPPEVDESDLIFTVTKNVPIKLPAWILAYRNAVNNDVVKVRGLPCPPGSLKLKDMTVGEEDEENGVPFCELAFKLHHRDDGWTELIPNRGRNELVKKKVFNLDKQKWETIKVRREILIGVPPEKPTAPQMLDAEGARIEHPTLENIHLLEFDFGKLKPFNALPLK